MFAYMRRGPNFYKEVAALAAPIILQDMITSTLSMADTFMVGLLGEEPMAAVTLANIPLFVVQLFIFGVQSGSTVLLSQYWGKQDMESINRIYGMALWLVMAVSPLWQRPGGGGAGRPIWPAGGAVLCIQRLFNDLYCSLPQYGASPTGNVHSGYLYGSEYLFELGIYFRKSGSARTGSSRGGSGHPHRTRFRGCHRGLSHG